MVSKKRFKGSVIITDPCYFRLSDPYVGSHRDPNFSTYIYRGTIYGDWSCTTFELKESSKDKPTEEISQEDIKGNIGLFCADAGLVGVFLLDEVLKFNPDFDYHVKRTRTTTLIEDFDGEIWDEVVSIDGKEPEVIIRGSGNINFITRQTGL